MSKAEILNNIELSTENIETPYHPSSSILIKKNIRKAWDRVKETRGFTQAQLASHLEITQSAVSKLLSNDNTHPWTIDKIIKFSEFCRVPIDEIIGNNGNLRKFFVGWTGPESTPNPELIEESFMALDLYFRNKGKSVSRSRLESLAGLVAVKVFNSDRTLNDFDRAITDVILEEAMKEI